MKGFHITKGVPVMAPHDWTGEGSGYGDLSVDAEGSYPGLGPPGCSGGCNVSGNVPCDPDPESKSCSREYDWDTMCNVNLPVAKGQEMKRACESCLPPASLPSPLPAAGDAQGGVLCLLSVMACN